MCNLYRSTVVMSYDEFFCLVSPIYIIVSLPHWSSVLEMYLTNWKADFILS